MGFFTKRKMKLNVLAFDLGNYEELNYNQLIEVNGGCGSGFWTGSKSFFNSGNSSNSYRSSFSSNGSCGSSTGIQFSSKGGNSSSFSSRTSISSSNGGCGGFKTKNQIILTNNKTLNKKKSEIIFFKGDPDQNPNLTTLIESTAYSHSEDKYVVSNNPTEEWRCDNYASAVIEQSGGDITKNFAGDPTQNTVQNHIDYGIKNYNLQANKKNNAPKLSNGAYVVFMNDSYIKSSKTKEFLDPHCGIIIINNGEITYSDNSSGNNNGAGGVSTTSYNSLQEFQNNYGYNGFYYSQVIKKD